jgi:hypothetical protein
MQAGHANVGFVPGDARAHRFERASYDLVISRFGVMFFEDPVGANDATMRELLIGELADRLIPYLTADGMHPPARLHLVTAAAPG